MNIIKYNQKLKIHDKQFSYSFVNHSFHLILDDIIKDLF